MKPASFDQARADRAADALADSWTLVLVIDGAPLALPGYHHRADAVAAGESAVAQQHLATVTFLAVPGPLLPPPDTRRGPGW